MELAKGLGLFGFDYVCAGGVLGSARMQREVELVAWKLVGLGVCGEQVSVLLVYFWISYAWCL